MALAGCSLVDNPDISGIGVRLAFYIQAFLTTVLAQIPNAQVDASYWSMTITAFALFVSALTLHAKQQLSLYQGILVSILLYLHAYAALVCLRSLFSTGYSPYADPQLTPRSKRQLFWFGLVRSFPVLCIASIFGIVLWHHAPTFGFQPECNDQTLFAFFGARLPAVRSGRTIALFFISLNIYVIAGCLAFGIALIIWEWALESARWQQTISPSLRYIRDIIVSIGNTETVRTSTGDRTHLYTRRYVPQRIFRQMVVIHGMAIAIFIGMFVLMLELTISYNAPLQSDDGDMNDTWTLGQIFPVVMLAVPLTSYLDVYRRHMEKSRTTTTRGTLIGRPFVGVELNHWHDHCRAYLARDF